MTGLKPTHFEWGLDDGVATIRLTRPERKNPLTFDSYAELTETFRALTTIKDLRALVLTGAGGNFCSGGDVHEIIGPLVAMRDKGDTEGLLRFTRMTGDLVKAMRACPQPIVAAIDGICAGAGAILAMASDRYPILEMFNVFDRHDVPVKERPARRQAFREQMRSDVRRRIG